MKCFHHHQVVKSLRYEKEPKLITWHVYLFFFHEINRDLELVFINTRKNVNMINDIEKKLEESIQQKTATDTENKVEQNESAKDMPVKDVQGKEETDPGSSDNVHEMSRAM